MTPINRSHWIGAAGAIVALAGVVGAITGNDIGFLLAPAGFLVAMFAWRS